MLGNFLSRLGFGGVPFIVPLLLQIGLSYKADLSGILLSPMAIGIVLAKPMVLPALRKFGYKYLLIINTCLTGIAIWLFISVNAQTSVYFIGFLTLFYGLIVTMQYSLMNSLVFAEVGSQDLSAASSLSSTMQQLAQSFGVAVSAILIRIFSTMFSKNLMITTAIIHDALFALGFITILSSTIFFRLKADDGQQMIF